MSSAFRPCHDEGGRRTRTPDIMETAHADGCQHRSASGQTSIVRLPLRLTGLIAAGMFFDSFDIYIAGTVLAALVQKRRVRVTTLNAAFVSATFIGMMAGAWLSGVLGDRFGRRFCVSVQSRHLRLCFDRGGAGAFHVLADLLPVGDGRRHGRGNRGRLRTLSEFIPAARGAASFGAILNLIINTSLFLVGMFLAG